MVTRGWCRVRELALANFVCLLTYGAIYLFLIYKLASDDICRELAVVSG